MVSSVIAQAIRWIVATFGKDILIVVKDAVQRQYQKLFASRNVLILGPKQTGKSSLLQFIVAGRPYQLVDGEIRPTAPTALGAIVDKKFSLQQGSWLRLKKDLPGDLDLRDTWAQAIADLQPAGILYMVDGRRSDEQLREDVRDIRGFVLDAYPSGGGQLAALHVVLNFADQWAFSSVDLRRRIRFVRDELEAVFDSAPQWSAVRLGVSAAQLSPNRKSWEEAERALHHFGADLKA